MQCYEKGNHLINKINLSQLKNLHKFMVMSINQQNISLNIHKTSDSDIFSFSFFQFWTQN